jgi:hypothetical protein
MSEINKVQGPSPAYGDHTLSGSREGRNPNSRFGEAMKNYQSGMEGEITSKQQSENPSHLASIRDNMNREPGKPNLNQEPDKPNLNQDKKPLSEMSMENPQAQYRNLKWWNDK